MGDSISVRVMTENDIEAVHAVEVASFSSPWSKESFESELLSNKFANYLVMTLNGQIIGFGGIWHVLEEGHITNIAIHPDFRGRGLGKVLVKEMVKWAKNVGILDMTLEVRRSNTVAISLYENLGFINHGIRPKYYQDNGEDAIIMWLRIQAEE